MKFVDWNGIDVVYLVIEWIHWKTGGVYSTYILSNLWLNIFLVFAKVIKFKQDRKIIDSVLSIVANTVVKVKVDTEQNYICIDSSLLTDRMLECPDFKLAIIFNKSNQIKSKPKQNETKNQSNENKRMNRQFNFFLRKFVTASFASHSGAEQSFHPLSFLTHLSMYIYLPNTRIFYR